MLAVKNIGAEVGVLCVLQVATTTLATAGQTAMVVAVGAAVLST